MAKEEITTIKLKKQTKTRLEKLRVHKRETYEEILQSMLGILNLCRSDPEKAQEKLVAIEKKIIKEKKENLEKTRKENY